MAKCHNRAFTLVEMMVVVVIVGVLATLAVVGYRKIVQSAHVSEATNMVTNIRIAQEAYHSETQQYAAVDTAIPTTITSGSGWYPTDPVYGVMTGWGGACTGTACNPHLSWTVLPVHVDGPVLFGYACLAGVAGTVNVPAAATANGSSVTFPTSATTDWYIIAAAADLDNNPSTYTQVWGDSFTNQVYVFNEGL